MRACVFSRCTFCLLVTEKLVCCPAFDELRLFGGLFWTCPSPVSWSFLLLASRWHLAVSSLACQLCLLYLIPPLPPPPPPHTHTWQVCVTRKDAVTSDKPSYQRDRGQGGNRCALLQAAASFSLLTRLLETRSRWMQIQHFIMTSGLHLHPCCSPLQC